MTTQLTMQQPILKPDKVPPANEGHVNPLSADERLLRKAVQRVLKAQVAEVHGRVEGGAKVGAVPVKTTQWDKVVMQEIRPIWFGLFKKGGDKALKEIRRFPRHARKMAVLSWAEMQASERVEVVEKGGPGSGNFGHEGRPGLVGGSGEGGGMRQLDRSASEYSYLPPKGGKLVSGLRSKLESVGGGLAASNHELNFDAPPGYVWDATGTSTFVVTYNNNSETWMGRAIDDEKETFALGFRLADEDELEDIRYSIDDNSWGAAPGSPKRIEWPKESATKSLKASPSVVIPDWIEDPDVLDALEREMFKFAHGINQTTADTLRDELMAGMEDGETIGQLANRISDISDEWVEGWRSEMIARTETARAFTTGHIEAWRSTGVVSRKVWVAAGDACPFCQEMDGTVVELDENFFDQGDEQTADWRGQEIAMGHDYSDVNGPPLHPNCRCALVAELDET